MNENEIAQARELVAEVADWLKQNGLFRGSKKESRQVYGAEAIAILTRPPSAYLDAIDVRQEVTVYTELEQLIAPIESAYRMVASYTDECFSEDISNAVDSLCKQVEKSPRTHELVQTLQVTNPNSMQISSHIKTTICRHFSLIVYGRVLTLSRRFGPTESLFHAYREGYFPFGWDWDENGIVCLLP